MVQSWWLELWKMLVPSQLVTFHVTDPPESTIDVQPQALNLLAIGEEKSFDVTKSARNLVQLEIMFMGHWHGVMASTQ